MDVGLGLTLVYYFIEDGYSVVHNVFSFLNTVESGLSGFS